MSQLNNMRNFLCIGHRGAKGIEPENTLRSIRKALELGVHGIEVDVYFAGGQLVVIHDETLERTTNGHGKVEEQTYDYLRSLDAGKGEKIPTLREVFDTVDQRAFVNVELKGAHTAEPVFELIGEYLGRKGWGRDEFLVSSFDHRELGLLKEKGIRLGPLFSERADYLEVARLLGAYSINIASRLADPSTVAGAHAAGLKTFVYTVNSPAEIEKMRAMGVDGIFTDFPDRVLEPQPAHR